MTNLFKNQKGSITIYVLTTMLFMLVIIISVYVNKSNNVNAQIARIQQIQEEYNSNLDSDLDKLYNNGIKYNVKSKKSYAQNENFSYEDVEVGKYNNGELVEDIILTKENTEITEIDKIEEPIEQNVESIKNPIRYILKVDCGEEVLNITLYKRGWYHIWKTGWAEGDPSIWYYHLGDGTTPRPYEEMELNLYYNPDGKSTFIFNEEGRMLTGWMNDGIGYKYFIKLSVPEEGGNIDGENSDIIINLGELKDSGFDHGSKVKNKFIKLWPQMKWYYIGDDGYRKTEWQQINESWYYFNNEGEMQTGLQKIDSKWYYLNESGEIGEYNETKIGDLGKMQGTGWIQMANGKYIYLDSNRNLLTGWQQINNSWYYLGTDGIMMTDWQQIDGYWYYLGTNGKMTTEWQQVGEYWYYLGTNGRMTTGWQQVNGKWYYLKPDSSFTAWSGPVGSMLKKYYCYN